MIERLPNSPGFRRRTIINKWRTGDWTIQRARVLDMMDALNKFKYPDNLPDIGMIDKARIAIERDDHAVDAFRYAMMALQEPKLTRWERIKMWFRARYISLKARIHRWLCDRGYHRCTIVFGNDVAYGMDTSVWAKKCKACGVITVFHITEYTCKHGFVSHCPKCK